MRPAGDAPPHDERLAGAFGIPEFSFPLRGKGYFHSNIQGGIAKMKRTKGAVLLTAGPQTGDKIDEKITVHAGNRGILVVR